MYSRYSFYHRQNASLDSTSRSPVPPQQMCVPADTSSQDLAGTDFYWDLAQSPTRYNDAPCQLHGPERIAPTHIPPNSANPHTCAGFFASAWYGLMPRSTLQDVNTDSILYLSPDSDNNTVPTASEDCNWTTTQQLDTQSFAAASVSVELSSPTTTPVPQEPTYSNQISYIRRVDRPRTSSLASGSGASSITTTAQMDRSANSERQTSFGTHRIFSSSIPMSNNPLRTPPMVSIEISEPTLVWPPQPLQPVDQPQPLFVATAASMPISSHGKALEPKGLVTHTPSISSHSQSALDAPPCQRRCQHLDQGCIVMTTEQSDQMLTFIGTKHKPAESYLSPQKSAEHHWPPKKKKVKMHGCSVCGKAFPRPSGLETHMNTHNNARPYPCTFPGCNRAFSVNSNAKRHLKTHFASSKHFKSSPTVPSSVLNHGESAVHTTAGKEDSSGCASVKDSRNHGEADVLSHAQAESNPDRLRSPRSPKSYNLRWMPPTFTSSTMENSSRGEADDGSQVSEDIRKYDQFIAMDNFPIMYAGSKVSKPVRR